MPSENDRVQAALSGSGAVQPLPLLNVHSAQRQFPMGWHQL